MASWDELKTYIHANYNVSKDDGGVLTLLFGTSGDRSQLVFVARSSTGSGIPFATIASPFAKVGEIDPTTVLRELSEYVVGGAVIYGDNYNVRHAVPLVNLDSNEFEAPLHLVLNAADALEKQFSGGDAF